MFEAIERESREFGTFGLDGGKLYDPQTRLFFWDWSPAEIQAVQETTLHKNILSSIFKIIHKYKVYLDY